MENKEFREFGHRIIDWVADYLDDVEKYRVLSTVAPGEIKSRLPLVPPPQGEPMEKILEDFSAIILPGITHWQHPGWFAYFPANNSPASVLAEVLTAGIGAQCMVWQTSPAATELEDRVLDWLRQMLGLPGGFVGVIQDAASTATLCALLSAREKATGFVSNEKGVEPGMTVYASDQVHSSIEKGVKMAGYGKANLRLIPTDEAYAMIPEELERAIVEDKKKGLKPACVVATIGTTSSTAVDPLPAVGMICKRHGVWLHVDAAFAGSACLLAEMKWVLEGAELMDSFVMNPHKWLLTNLDCSAYFVKDPSLLVRTFEVHPEYLTTGVDTHVKNYRDWGIQLGRRFRALKLWFVIRSSGVEGLQAMIREHIRLAQLFRSWVEDQAMFEVMTPTPFSLVCFRFNDGKEDGVLNVFNKKLLERVNATGKVFLTHTVLRGRYVLRMAIGQRTTRERHVRETWEIIVRSAEELIRE